MRNHQIYQEPFNFGRNLTYMCCINLYRQMNRYWTEKSGESATDEQVALFAGLTVLLGKLP